MTRKPDIEGPIVAKLGGSLWRSPLLADWIAALRRFPHGATIVSGGGPFADAVRAAQPVMGFSTRAAHGMAMLAMAQYGLALADLFEGLAPVETPEEAAAAHARGALALWRPSRMVEGAQDVAASWDVTSDSLAAWFARQSGAAGLLMIKSVDPRPGANIVAEGVVDPCFPTYARGLRVHVAGPAALTEAGALLAAGALPGLPWRGSDPSL